MARYRHFSEILWCGETREHPLSDFDAFGLQHFDYKAFINTELVRERVSYHDHQNHRNP